MLDVRTIGREERTAGIVEIVDSERVTGCAKEREGLGGKGAVVDGAGGLVCGIGPNMEGALVEWV